MTNRIVLVDEGGVELFSGFSVSSFPPAQPAPAGEPRKALESLSQLAEEVLNALDSDPSLASSPSSPHDDDACPPTLRSIAPSPPPPSKETDESGVFIRAAESRSRIALEAETSKKMVDERVA